MLEGDLLIGMDEIFHMNFWARDEGYLNQRIVRFRTKEDSPVSIIQVYFELMPYIKAIENRKTRTTVAHLSDQDLKQLLGMLPQVNKFFNPKETFNEPLQQILLNRKQNEELIHLRDFLLPLPMNGQVKVG